MDHDDDEFVAFIGGLLLGGLLVFLVFWIASAEATSAKEARTACQAAGFHGGTYDATRGFICFNYVSQRLP